MRIAWFVLAWVAVAAPAFAGEAALDTGYVSDAALQRACADQSQACAKAIIGCEATRSRVGGYLAHSHLEHQCTVLGVPAPSLDLSAAERAQVEASCAQDPRGVACRSLDHACATYGDGTGFANLTAACVLVEAAATRKPPQAPGVDELWAGLAVGSVSDPELLGDTSTTIAAEIAMRGLVGLHQVAPAVSFDLALGSTSSGGFLYRLDVGWGVGLRLAHDGQLSLTIGGGFSGITGGPLGFALEVPVTATATIPFGPRLRGLIGGRGTFVFTENARQHGIPDVPLYDEVEVKVGVARAHREMLWGVYGFLSHARETAILGIALAVGYAEVHPGPNR